MATATPASDATDLAQLMTAFNEVTARLHETHDHLQREVVRLRVQLRDANEQLERSRRLAALGQMAAGIAHEVRNPLGSIRLYARMLEDDLGEQPAQREVASKIAGAVTGLDAIVGDVLNFAREIEVRPAPADVLGLIRMSLDAAIGPKDADGLIVRTPGSDTPEVVCDGSLIRQVLVNLIRNGVEAMAGADRRELDIGVLFAGDGTAVLSVMDTGCGIDQEALDHIFNPFYTTRSSGTGLGLAIVHRIVDAHGGRIVVRSRSDATSAIDSGARGTTIKVHLPQPEADD